MPRTSLAWLLSLLIIAGFAFPARAQEAKTLPGTQLWKDDGDPSSAMVAGINRFLDRALAESVSIRASAWKVDRSSAEAYLKSVAPNRARFEKNIGAVDVRVAKPNLSVIGTSANPGKLAETDRFSVAAVRWDVFEDVEAEGLWLEPKGQVRASVVVVPDADVEPEALAGLKPGLPAHSQTARLMAEAGCRVLVPTLLSRADTFSGNPKVRMTNLSHREWIWRMSYELGRHPIGYEVETVRAGLDWLKSQSPEAKLGVVGHGEGGLIALYTAAVDTRVDAAWVGGYFAPRERICDEPIDRDVWALLTEFGDAELTRLVAPRALLIEACRGAEVKGPNPPRNGRADAAGGSLATPEPDRVAAEFAKAQPNFEGLGVGERLKLVKSGDGKGDPNLDDDAREAFCGLIGLDVPPPVAEVALRDPRPGGEATARMKRLVSRWSEHTLKLFRTSELRRMDFWKKADAKSVGNWVETTKPYRDTFWEEAIGKFPKATEAGPVESRQIHDEPKFRGYAVRMPVFPDVVASGVLLLPKDQKPGEKRPVVVCQHGLEGKPDDIVDPRIKSVYNSYGAQLADLGYIVYAPQNPYIGKEKFRIIQRKAHPLKRSLFAMIVRQHEKTLEWLKSLDGVDPSRIAFYGLSYGGKSAMRLPAILTDYCLSICSADFDEWILKNVNTDRQYSYMFTIEYDMYEFGLGDTYNYAEMANLIAPRPFMVERGHQDGVAPDEWVFYEYAKVKRQYDALGLGDRVGMALFNGGHMIDGKDTFAFLAKHLKWPK